MNKIIQNNIVLAYICHHIEVTTQELKTHFKISPATVNRILRTLKEQNFIVVLKNKVVYKPAVAFKYGSVLEVQQKNILAQNVAMQIPNGITISLCGGSTTISLICPYIILYKKNITIISNSILVFKIFSDLYHIACKNNISLITIGGLLQHDLYSFGGEYSELIFSNFFINQTYLGVESINIDKNSVFTDTLQETIIENKIKESSQKTYLVCLQDKFYATKLYKWANLTDFDGVFSDFRNSSDLYPKGFFKYFRTQHIIDFPSI